MDEKIKVRHSGIFNCYFKEQKLWTGRISCTTIWKLPFPIQILAYTQMALSKNETAKFVWQNGYFQSAVAPIRPVHSR
jgi:hypothetical protein